MDNIRINIYGSEIIDYKGFEIDLSTYSKISVFYAGDEYLFDTIEAAKKFIDNIE